MRNLGAWSRRVLLSGAARWRRRRAFRRLDARLSVVRELGGRRFAEDFPEHCERQP